MEKKESIDAAELIDKMKIRGNIHLMYFENFKKFKIDFHKSIERFQYKSEEEIIQKYEDNIENNRYFNVIFLNHDNKDDAFSFLISFIDKAQDKGIAKNNSDYPFFVFFENQNFNKEILYSYYIENTKEKNISRFYDLKSHNIYFIKRTKQDIEELISREIVNYYYEFDFKSDSNTTNSYKIEILFMGQTGCGKSTFINYLLGKLRAFSASMSNFKSKGGTYTHTKYPISIKDSEGFEINSEDQQKKIFDLLKKNIEEELSNRTHIAFYLIPGPFNSSRDLDYSCIGSFIKLEEYNIHYYLIMTKDPEECQNFSKVSLRFLNGIIKKKDFKKINSDLNEEKLIEILNRIKNKLQDRIFSVDVSKRESQTINLLLNQVYEDLKIEKENNEKFIIELKNKKEQGSNFQIDFSGSQIINDKNNFEFPEAVKNSPFFNLKKFSNNSHRNEERAKKVIKEAQDVSSIRKLFFCYNSKIRDNRKKMLNEILSIFDCKYLTIDLLESRLSNKEKDEWFYQHDCTEDLGNKIIAICQDELKKRNVVDNYIDYCLGFNRSIDDFGEYVKEFTNFKLNGQKIPYDCDLKI